MKQILVALLCSMGLIAAARAATPEADLTAPLHQFVDSFNKGDAAAAEAANVPAGMVVVDEVSPHLWTGAGAFKAWAKDLETHDKNAGVTDQRVTLGQVIRTESNANNAYVVIDAVYTFKQKGLAMREPAKLTAVLQNVAGAWKIAAWTWSGNKPKDDK